MNWFLLSFLGTAGAIVVACCILVLLVRHRINRRHRVHPKVPTPAPLTWMADPRAAARLHRRLAKVGRTAGVVADDHRVPHKKLRRSVEQPPMVELAEQLRSQAIQLDHQVARTASLPTTVRRAQLVQLSRSVAEAEHACVRLVSVSTQARTPAVLAHQADGDVDITDVAAQVERLAEAHRILQQLDQGSGLAPAPASVAAPAAPPLSSPSAR